MLENLPCCHFLTLATMEIFQLDHGVGTQSAQGRLDWFAGIATRRAVDGNIYYRDSYTSPKNLHLGLRSWGLYMRHL